MRIEFHPEVCEEMLESTWRIEQFPDAAPVETSGVRKRLVFSFPLTILYERQEDVIYIAAVMHRHRKPGYWKDRLLT